MPSRCVTVCFTFIYCFVYSRTCFSEIFSPSILQFQHFVLFCVDLVIKKDVNIPLKLNAIYTVCGPRYLQMLFVSLLLFFIEMKDTVRLLYSYYMLTENIATIKLNYYFYWQYLLITCCII